MGGKVTISTSHEDGKGDYGAEVAALAQAGGDVLIVAGYLDQGGKGVIQASIDAGAFDVFVLPDGMIGDSLPAAIGKDLNGSYGTLPGTDSPGAAKFNGLAAAASAPWAAAPIPKVVVAPTDAPSTDSYRATAVVAETYV